MMHEAMGIGDPSVQDLNRRVDRAVVSIRGGDSDAFIDIVHLLEPQARSWVAHRCPPEVDPDELAHQAFIKAYRHLDAYQLGSNFRAWFFQILRNLLLAECARVRDRSRAHSRFVVHALAVEQERLVAATAVEPDDDEAMRVQALQDCLQHLSPAARDLVQRRYQGDCDLGTIAHDTERSLGAIKKAFFKIRQHLLDCLRRRLPERVQA